MRYSPRLVPSRTWAPFPIAKAKKCGDIAHTVTVKWKYPGPPLLPARHELRRPQIVNGSVRFRSPIVEPFLVSPQGLLLLGRALEDALYAGPVVVLPPAAQMHAFTAAVIEVNKCFQHLANL